MEDIKDIVLSIVKGCEHTGVDVPEVLAAFVARTVLMCFVCFLKIPYILWG